jgi:hypothetical protein
VLPSSTSDAPTSSSNNTSSSTMMSFRSSSHEGFGFGHAAAAAAAAASGAPLPWWAGPAPMLSGEPLALSPEAHCRDGRIQAPQGPPVSSVKAPVLAPQQPPPLPERGIPELLNLSVDPQGQELRIRFCLCVCLQVKSCKFNLLKPFGFRHVTRRV